MTGEKRKIKQQQSSDLISKFYKTRLWESVKAAGDNWIADSMYPNSSKKEKKRHEVSKVRK